MLKRKRIKVFFLLFLGLALLTGCSGREENRELDKGMDEKTYNWGAVSGKTITIWGNGNELERPYISGIIERYQALTGNTVITTALSREDWDELVPRAFASGGGDRPDILLSHGGTGVENLNPDENFYDFIEAPWIDDLTDTAINQAVYNGRVIGLPYGEASVSGTLYNKELFKKYKIEVPQNQKQFLEACETLLQNGVTPVYLPYAENTMLLYQFPMDSILRDQNILDQLNKGTMSYAQIPEMREIVKWYKTMSDRGYFGDNYLENNWEGMDGAMKSGKYAMMLCWDTWLYTNYTGDASEIGLMPAFMGVPENGSFEGANVLLLLVNKKSAQLEAVLDFISFSADPYNYNIAFEGVYTAPIFNNQNGSIATPQYAEAERLVERLFYNSTAWLRLRGFSQADAAYIGAYMQNECSLEECLENMEEARRKRAGIVPPEAE